MALETEGFIDQIAEMLNSVRIHCNGCGRDYYGSVTYNAETQSPRIRGVCPRCGSRDLQLAETD